MATVYTKEEFKTALENKETKILAKGEFARELTKKGKRKKGAIIGGISAIAAGVAALPFTGGASAAGIGAGAYALTIGTITISTSELAILCGFALGMYGISKDCKVTYNSDGSVTIEPKYNK